CCGRLSTCNGQGLLSPWRVRCATDSAGTACGCGTPARPEPDGEVVPRPSKWRMQLATAALPRAAAPYEPSGRAGGGSAGRSVRPSNGDISLASVGGSK